MTGNSAARRLPLGLAAVAALLATGPGPAGPPGAAVAVEEVNETFPSHGKRVAVERFSPREAGRYPVVVLLHGVGGIGPPDAGSPLREQARRLARLGFVALIPHYFDRTGAKLNNARRNARYYDIWMETVSDAVTYAGRLPQADRRRVGLLGFSLGGSVALSNAMVDPRVTAVVEYFGSLVGAPPLQLPTMPPTLILHGDADRTIPVSEARKLSALFNEWQVRFEIKIYPGAGHGFRGVDEEDAWKRTVDFFARHLKAT
jgi:carboxymethylenebutenolidase